MSARPNPHSKKVARSVLRKKKSGKKKKAQAKKVLYCSVCKKRAVTRGLCHKHYSEVMHDIARGRKSEKSLIKKGILLSGKGITKGRDDKLFYKKQKTRGRAANATECLVPACKNTIRNSRGLCVTHHSYAWDLIRKGSASEEDLVKRRLMRPNGARKTSKKLSRNRKGPKKKKVSKRISKKKKKAKLAKRKAEKIKPWTSESKADKYKVCRVKSCRIKEDLRTGLCKKHYMQMRRNKSANETDLLKRGLKLKPRTTKGYRKRVYDLLKKGAAAKGKALKGRCSLPRCIKKPRYRGMCKRHYLYTRTLIRRDEASEQDLVSRGIMLPKTSESHIFSQGSKDRGSLHRW